MPPKTVPPSGRLCPTRSQSCTARSSSWPRGTSDKLLNPSHRPAPHRQTVKAEPKTPDLSAGGARPPAHLGSAAGSDAMLKPHDPFCDARSNRPANAARRPRRRGGAILEAALVLPALVLLTFGGIEFGDYFFVKHTLDAAA